MASTAETMGGGDENHPAFSLIQDSFKQHESARVSEHILWTIADAVSRRNWREESTEGDNFSVCEMHEINGATPIHYTWS